MAWLVKRKRTNPRTGRKANYYTIDWRDPNGQIKSKSIGFCSIREAKRTLRAFNARLASGAPLAPTVIVSGSSATPTPAPAPAPPQLPTLREYLEQSYLPVVQRDRAPKTYMSARSSANALIGILGNKRLNEINYAVVDSYLSKRKKLGRKSRTLQIELWCLGRALQHAHDSGVLAAVPNLPRIQVRDQRPHRYLTSEESEQLLEALRPLDTQPHVVTRGRPPITRDRLTYLAVLMALNTGMRLSEILTRGWEDVHWDQGIHGVILVRPKPSIGFRMKTGHDRVIPLTPELETALLQEHQRVGTPARGWIFPSPRDPTKPRSNFRQSLRRACQRAGLPIVHPHALRHSWASRMAVAGVDRRTLMELGGWKVGAMLDQIYAHVTDQHKVEVMSRMGITSTSDQLTEDGEE